MDFSIRPFLFVFRQSGQRTRTTTSLLNDSGRRRPTVADLDRNAAGDAYFRSTQQGNLELLFLSFSLSILSAFCRWLFLVNLTNEPLTTIIINVTFLTNEYNNN